MHNDKWALQATSTHYSIIHLRHYTVEGWNISRDKEPDTGKSNELQPLVPQFFDMNFMMVRKKNHVNFGKVMAFLVVYGCDNSQRKGADKCKT